VTAPTPEERVELLPADLIGARDEVLGCTSPRSLHPIGSKTGC
jgi:hypothetical protein